MHFYFDRLFGTGGNQDLRSVARYVDGRTKDWTRPVAGSYATDSGNENIVATIFGSVVRTAMRLDAPVAWELRRNAARTCEMCGTVEECEIGRDEVGAGGCANG